jgi:hypothetical protein
MVQEFQLAGEGMQGMCRRGADPIKLEIRRMQQKAVESMLNSVISNYRVPSRPAVVPELRIIRIHIHCYLRMHRLVFHTVSHGYQGYTG